MRAVALSQPRFLILAFKKLIHSSIRSSSYCFFKPNALFHHAPVAGISNPHDLFRPHNFSIIIHIRRRPVISCQSLQSQNSSVSTKVIGHASSRLEAGT